jgi:hypothetical protein
MVRLEGGHADTLLLQCIRQRICHMSQSFLNGDIVYNPCHLTFLVMSREIQEARIRVIMSAVAVIPDEPLHRGFVDLAQYLALIFLNGSVTADLSEQSIMRER